jgi:PAS domain S-box-containing protein
VNVLVDITERKEAENAARNAAQRFHFMAETMPQKIFTATANGEINYFNRQWAEFTGLTFDQIRDWGWTHFIHPDDVEENIRVWRHSIETGEPFEFVHRFRRADGAYRWHLSRARAMRSAAGNISMWIGTNTEIHEQKEMAETLRQREETLRESEAYLRLVLDSAADGFYGVDRDGVTTTCNAAFLCMLGFERAEDVVGKKLHDVIQQRTVRTTRRRNAIFTRPLGPDGQRTSTTSCSSVSMAAAPLSNIDLTPSSAMERSTARSPHSPTSLSADKLRSGNVFSSRK